MGNAAEHVHDALPRCSFTDALRTLSGPGSLPYGAFLNLAGMAGSFLLTLFRGWNGWLLR